MSYSEAGRVKCDQGRSHEIVRDTTTGAVGEVKSRGVFTGRPTKVEPLNINVSDDAKALVVAREKLKHHR